MYIKSLLFPTLALAGLAIASYATRDLGISGTDHGASLPFSSGMSGPSISNSPNSDSVLTYQLALDNSTYLQGSGGTGYLYFEARATNQLPQQVSRIPLNLSLVIDHSGSMAGEKLENAKKAALFLVDQLQQEDYLSLVIYDSEVEVLVGQVSAGAKEKFKSAIQGISQRGGTNLCGGMQEGLNQLDAHYRAGFVNRVLLLSDGLANEGIVDPMRIAGIASSYSKEKGITVSTFGVGLGFNEDLMTSIAESGNGSYYFIARPNEIPQLLSKELDGLMTTVAQNAVLNVTLPEGVQLERVFGYNYEQHDRQVEIRFREIFAGEVKSVLIRFRYSSDLTTSQDFLATLQYNDALHDGIFRSASWKETASATADPLAYDHGFRQDVREQVVVFEANDRMEEAMRAADGGEYDKARELIQANGDALRLAIQSGYSSYYLIQQDSVNSQYFEQLQRAEDMGEMEMNEMQKSNKSMNYEVRKKKKP